jgi:glycosyltransferase involved in cell wall biosynthesis
MNCIEKLSIIIPVYRSESFLEHTVEEVIFELDKLDVDYEILLVDDGSPDGSWGVAEQCGIKYSCVKSIKLVRNYGQHTAVFCGIEHSIGDYIITMDDDLQNPPSEIYKLLNKIREGYDLVFAEFESKKHSGYRRVGSRVVDYLNAKIFDKPNDIVLTNFRIFTKEVASRVAAYRGHEPYIPGLLLMNSSRIANELTRHEARSEGGSNYTLKKIASLIARLLFNYSSYPLRFLSLAGGAIALISFVWGGITITRQVFIGSEVEGWTTLVALVSFLNGFLILMLGVLGEYVVRLVNTVSQEQGYHVSKVIDK